MGSIPCFLALLILAGATQIPAEVDPKKCKERDCLECPGETCVHGSCVESSCRCLPCWTGNLCDIYEDGPPPVFRSNTVQVARSSIRPYRVEAYHADLEETCQNEPCACARVRYTLIDGSDLFDVDETTGELRLLHPDPPASGRVLRATIKASSWETGLYNDSSFITIEFLEEKSAVKHRGKRQTEDTEHYRTEFELILSEGEPQLEIGRWVQYLLTIKPPATSGMDLTVELFTQDEWTDSFSPTLALYNVHVEEQASSSSLSFPDPEISLFPSARYPTVYDRVKIDFGELSSGGGAEDQIKLIFSAAMVRNPDTDLSRKHHVTVGAEFDKQRYIWVGQSEIAVAKAKEDEDKKPMKLSLRGPDTIKSDSAGVFFLDAFLGLRSDPVAVEVELIHQLREGQRQFLSTGNLGLHKFGEHFAPVPPSPYLYNATFHFTEQEDVRDRASLDMGLLTNIGPIPQPAEDEKNKIIFTFSLYALNGTLEEPLEAKINVSVILSGSLMESLTKDVSVIEREPSPSPTEVLSVTSIVPYDKLSPGQLAVYTLIASLQEDGFLSLRVSLTPPKGSLTPCKARLRRVPSSFDLPYINGSLVTVMGPGPDGRFVAFFPRTHITSQRTPAKHNDTLLEVEILATVTNDPANKAGRKITVLIEVEDGISQHLVDVAPVTITATDPSIQKPGVVLANAVKWKQLYAEGAVAFNVTMEAPLAAGYPDMLFEANGTNPKVKICQARVVEVPQYMPCLDPDYININKTTLPVLSSPKGIRAARMYFGNTGCVHQPLIADQKSAPLVVRVAVGADADIKPGGTEMVRSGFYLTTDLVWAGVLKYPVPDGEAPKLAQEQRPRYSVQGPSSPTPPGEVARIELAVQTVPDSLGPYSIEMTADSTALSICVLQVAYIGRNLPCVEEDKQAEYIPHDDPNMGIKSSALRFNALSNVGMPSSKTLEGLERGENTLVVMATIRVAGNQPDGEATLKWRVNVGDDPQPQRLMLPIGPRSETEKEKMSEEVVRRVFLSRLSDQPVIVSAPLTVLLDLELDFLAQSPVTGVLQSSLPATLCLAGVNFRGANYPCLFPSELIFTANSSKEVSFNLGTVCNAAVNKVHPKENMVQLGLSLLPQITSPEEWILTGKFTVGKKDYIFDEMVVPMAEKMEDLNTPEFPEVKIINETVKMKVRTRAWLHFNVTIPRNATLPLSIVAIGAERGGRAILTVHGLRFVSAGANIPCPAVESFPVDVGRTIPTTQYNKAKARFGYFSNLGLTHGSNRHQDWDDHVTLAVLVGMSDHPVSASQGSSHPVNLEVTLGKGATTKVPYPVQVERDGTESVLLLSEITVEDSRAFKRGEKIPIKVRLRHSEDSRAEPRAVALRLYLPPYLSLGGMTSLVKMNLSANPEVVGEEGGIDIKVPFLVFEDEMEMRLDLIADPNNKLGFGRGEVSTTVPYRALCQLRSCSRVSHFSLQVNSQECYEPLGLQNGAVRDCQITADTAATPERAPYKARLKAQGKQGWSPAFRPGLKPPFLQVDFMRRVRVSMVEVERMPGSQAVTQYSLLFSDTGSDWITAREGILLNYTGNFARDKLPHPFQARYVRVRVDASAVLSDKKSNPGDDSQYVLVRLELYGCPLEERSSTETCGNDTTWYSTDSSKPGRHFVVDTKNDIVYFCDLDETLERLQCYSSSDGGKTWRGLGRTIGGVVGYDSASGRTYVRGHSGGNGHGAYLASSDGGATWTAVNPQALESRLDRLTRPFTVPALSKPDLARMGLAEGKWHASFDGLHYDGGKEAVAKWSQCCLASHL